MRIGIIGATGIAVQVLVQGNLDVIELYSASPGSVGKRGSTQLGVKKPNEDYFSQWVPVVGARGVMCNDNGSAFRIRDGVVKGESSHDRPQIDVTDQCSAKGWLS